MSFQALKLGTLALILAPLVATAQPVTNNNAGWEMWMARIYDLVAKNQSGDALRRIQVVTAPRHAEWQTNKTLGPYQWCTFADSIPQLGGEYVPSSSSVYEQYQQFIDGLNIPPPDESKQKQMEAAREEYERQREKLDKLREDAMDAWVKFDKRQRTSFPEAQWKSWNVWYPSSQWGNKVGNQKTAVSQANQKYVSLVAKTFKGMNSVNDAIGRARNEAYVKDIEGDKGVIYHCPQYALTPTVESFTAQSNKVVWDFVSNKERKTIESSSLRGGGSISVGFFKFGGSGGGSWSKVEEEKEKVDMKVEFQNLGRATVQPGPWFSKVLISTFNKEGPYIAGSPITKGGAVWWRDQGRFSWIPKEVLLAYRPKFTITLSASRYSQVKSSIDGGGGFGIGPFSFGAKGNKNYERIEFDDAKNTVSLEDLSDSPMILAVINEPLGDN